MTRLLVVDDQPAVRRGIKMRLQLEPDLEVVGEAGDGEGALRLVQQLRPDVVIMDCDMPCPDGLAAAGRVRDLSPETAVVCLTLHGDNATRARAQAVGAAAFVEKHEGERALLSAIRRVCNRKRDSA